MVKRTGSPNPQMTKLISELKKTSIEQSVGLWKRIASDLEKPTRSRRAVNLSRINRFSKENETIIVPGKVLGSGMISHKITIAAFSFSESALEKLKNSNCTAISIQDLVSKKPKTSDIRIIG